MLALCRRAVAAPPPRALCRHLTAAAAPPPPPPPPPPSKQAPNPGTSHAEGAAAHAATTARGGAAGKPRAAKPGAKPGRAPLPREHPDNLRRMTELSQFARLHDKIGRRVLTEDIAVPLGVLVELVRKEAPGADARSHPRVVALLGDIRSALDTRECVEVQRELRPGAGDTGGAAAAAATAAATGAAAATHYTALRPAWRSSLKAQELARLAAYLVQLRLDDDSHSLLAAALARLPDVVRWLGGADTARVMFALTAAPGAAVPAALPRALVAHAASQVAFLDATGIATVAGYLCAHASVGVERPLFSALAERLSQLLAHSPPRRGAPPPPPSMPPAKLALALTALAAAGVRTQAVIAATGEGYSMGGPGVERAVALHVRREARGWGARELASIARAAGVMGLRLEPTGSRLPPDGLPAVANRAGREVRSSSSSSSKRARAGGAGQLLAAQQQQQHAARGAHGGGEGEAEDPLWAALEARAVSLLPSLAPIDLSFLVASFAHASRLAGWEAAKRHAVRAAAVAAVHGTMLTSGSGGGYGDAKAAGAVGGAGGLDDDGAPVGARRVGSDAFWAGMRTAVLARLDDSSVSQVAWAAWAFASVEHADPELLAAACSRVGALLDGIADADRAQPPPPPPSSELVGDAALAAHAGQPPAELEEAASARRARVALEDAAGDEEEGAAGVGATPDAPSAPPPPPPLAGWGRSHWAALRVVFAGGDPVLATASNFARTLGALPPAVMAGAASLDEAAGLGDGGDELAGGGAAAEAAVAAHPERLRLVLAALTQLVSTMARACFEAAVAADAAAGRPGDEAAAALARDAGALMPLALVDGARLLEAASAYLEGVAVSLQTGLLVAPGAAQGRQGELLPPPLHPAPPEATAALAGAVEQLAVGLAVQVLHASPAALAASGASGGRGRLARLLTRTVSRDGQPMVAEALARLDAAARQGGRRARHAVG